MKSTLMTMISLLCIFNITQSKNSSPGIQVMNMQIRNGLAYYKPYATSRFSITSSNKNKKLGQIFNITHIPSNKTCGFSPVTRIFQCDSKNPNTVRILDKHGMDNVLITSSQYIKFRMTLANEDCRATMKSPLKCTKEKLGEYGWFVAYI